MKILILYTYNKGLLSSFFQELSMKLSNDGHTVFNYFLKHRKESFIQNGVEIYGDKRGSYVSNYKHIYKIIKQTQPDVIISNFSYVNPALLFGKLLKVKKNIVWFHTVYGHSAPSVFKVWVKALFLKMADIVIANSKVLEQELHSIYGVAKNRTTRIPFWTTILDFKADTEFSGIHANKSVLKVGCPGRLVADKNHEVVINAIHQLKNEDNQIHLYIAGDGDYKKELMRNIEKLDLESEITFLGQLNVNEMAAFYNQMDVVVLPSLHEAFGLVFIEAIALGIPVIVSTEFGALNFIDLNTFSVDTFTFNPKSVEGLKEKLMSYIRGEGLSSEFFKEIYHKTFEKEVIYQSIKSVINLKTDNPMA
ncbi:Glycosyltransferase involved in cell wall bisynthesis [Formosa sp. Hel1_31_208]|uniref:glycosyltransferase family 4 protein n=1 Tax=Formosa sp. Hel1_31_208 TaxID=1798225 RepID=UPI000879F61E|nr:glycosyltransferase family 4 protein [Formosa sp. Hel1_31_208]SDS68538.1 Glycosyltransferase involved in cell wall bisynthesis [Formosa sp. Hel1_31_208]